ncbi:hypothetical protein PFISCL1PPCAC_6697, partial [Pristionchus fissidentatus]
HFFISSFTPLTIFSLSIADNAAFLRFSFHLISASIAVSLHITYSFLIAALSSFSSSSFFIFISSIFFFSSSALAFSSEFSRCIRVNSSVFSFICFSKVDSFNSIAVTFASNSLFISVSSSFTISNSTDFSLASALAAPNLLVNLRISIRACSRRVNSGHNLIPLTTWMILVLLSSSFDVPFSTDCIISFGFEISGLFTAFILGCFFITSSFPSPSSESPANLLLLRRVSSPFFPID